MLAACEATPAAFATPTIAQREQAWLQQEISAYQIEVLVVRSVWHAQSHLLIIQNGQVESATATCIPAPTEAGQCRVEDFAAEDYTVEGLFRQAEVHTQGKYAAWVTVTYDPSYGFPQQISYNHPEIIDEDWSWRVTSFEVLK